MVTVVTIGTVRVVLYSNDHPPPHVHLIDFKNGKEARLALNCPNGPMSLLSNKGFTAKELHKIVAQLNVSDLCRRWSQIHV